MPSFQVDPEMPEIAAEAILECAVDYSKRNRLTWYDSSSKARQQPFHDAKQKGCVTKFPVEAIATDLSTNEFYAKHIGRCVYVRYEGGIYHIITAEPLERFLEKRMNKLCELYRNLINGRPHAAGFNVPAGVPFAAWLPNPPRVTYGGKKIKSMGPAETEKPETFDELQLEAVKVTMNGISDAGHLDPYVKKVMLETLSLRFKVKVDKEQAKKLVADAAQWIKEKNEAENQPGSSTDGTLVPDPRLLTPEMLQEMLEAARNAGRAEGKAEESGPAADQHEIGTINGSEAGGEEDEKVQGRNAL